MKPKRVRSGKHVRARGGAKVKRSPRGLLLAAIGVIVVLILVVYFTIASSYKGRFLGRTTINGLNCSGKTVQEVNTAMNLQAKNYVLTLKEREGKTETINGGDIDLTYVDNGQVAELLDGISPYGWLWSQIRGTELMRKHPPMPRLSPATPSSKFRRRAKGGSWTMRRLSSSSRRASRPA